MELLNISVLAWVIEAEHRLGFGGIEVDGQGASTQN